MRRHGIVSASGAGGRRPPLQKADRGGFSLPTLLLLSLILLLFLLSACAQETVPPDVIAKVGDQSVTAADFEGYLTETLGREATPLPAAARSTLLDFYLEETALTRLARERGVTVGEGAEARRRAVERMVTEASGGALGERELHEAFEASRASGELDTPARVRLRQILVQDRSVAEAARAEIVGGTDFGAVAERLSADSTSAIGGDQGALSREDLPPALADDIFDLEEGEVSPVIEAEYGFHLFQVLERLPPRTADDFERVRPELEDRLRRQRADAALAALVAEARSRYDVAVYARNLPFDYRGAYHEGRPDQEAQEKDDSP